MSSLTNSTLTVDTLDCSGIKLKNDSAYLRDYFPFSDFSFDISGAFKDLFNHSDDGSGIHVDTTGDSIEITLGSNYPSSDGFSLTSSQTDAPRVTVTETENGYKITTDNFSGIPGGGGLGVELGGETWSLNFHKLSTNNSISHALHLYFPDSSKENRAHMRAYRNDMADFCWKVGGSTTEVSSSKRPGLYIDVAHGMQGILGITSDARLKENKLPITNAIASINKVNILKYDKLQKNKYIPDVGVVAQELEETNDPLLLQCLVIPVNKENLYTVNYDSLFAIHVKALQELYQDVTQNKRETMALLERLENKINILEKNN